MKKNILIASILVVIGATIPMAAMAITENPWTVNIYRIASPRDERCGGTSCGSGVSTFDDRGNKCYVVTYDNNVAISCVKQG